METSGLKYKIDTIIEDKNVCRFSHQAMATIFEIMFLEENEDYAAKAADSAFRELDRLEQELSYFLENSDISRTNNLSQNEIITIGPDAFNCLKQCERLYQNTKGAFDITMRPLFEVWQKYSHHKTNPSKSEIALTMSIVGLPWLHILLDTHEVRLMNTSIQIDLGGFGKGYAIDVLKNHLDDWEFRSGLIHSGQSTVSTFGKEPDSMKWPLSISDPMNSDILLKKMDLNNGAISGSGLKKGQHIIDPRIGKPIENKLAAWAFAPQAGEADALSTAFMVMTSEEIENYCKKYKVCGITIANDRDNTKQFYGEWA